ncbi:MAG: hypothetical protein B7Z66_11415 [Chromatiales bacterium 21-64-14]|nr:MAG: hypothetical protein B7Z66_11415 [Chromatiales bacterium 21-64-14]HQU17380.1 zf-HC2 domain-containing protein [Gammaproteobacteria bacterium]
MIGGNCKEVAQLLSRAQDRRLSWRQRMAVRIHLLLCVYCRRYARQLQWLQRALTRGRDDAQESRLDEAARRRINDRLRESRDREDR